LSRLVEVAEIKILAELTPYCIEARYGDFKESLSEIINEQKAKEVYEKTQEIFKWLYREID
jgi:HEPN domain-containing protein